MCFPVNIFTKICKIKSDVTLSVTSLCQKVSQHFRIRNHVDQTAERPTDQETENVDIDFAFSAVMRACDIAMNRFGRIPGFSTGSLLLNKDSRVSHLADMQRHT